MDRAVQAKSRFRRLVQAACLRPIGPISDATSRTARSAAQDRLFGVSDPGGITPIFISDSSGAIAVDHVQYGNGLFASPRLLPGALPLFATGLGALVCSAGAGRRIWRPSHSSY
jgi:hypothetical protein